MHYKYIHIVWHSVCVPVPLSWRCECVRVCVSVRLRACMHAFVLMDVYFIYLSIYSFIYLSFTFSILLHSEKIPHMTHTHLMPRIAMPFMKINLSLPLKDMDFQITVIIVCHVLHMQAYRVADLCVLINQILCVHRNSVQYVS